MNANERGYLNQLAERSIGAAFEVSNVLGAGFLEKVYQRALHHELQLRGLHSVMEYPLHVRYKQIIAGDYSPDLIVENKLILELKCVAYFAVEHMAQALDYLKAKGFHLVLLFTFQKPKVKIKRAVNNF